MAFCEGDHGLQKVNPPKFEEMVVGIIGQEKYDALMSHKNDLMFYTRPDLNDKLAELRKLLKYYTGPIWRKYQF